MNERLCAWPGRKAVLSILICMLYEWALMRLAWQKGCFTVLTCMLHEWASWRLIWQKDHFMYGLYDRMVIGNRQLHFWSPVAFWCALKWLCSRHLLILVFSSLIQLKDMVRGSQPFVTAYWCWGHHSWHLPIQSISQKHDWLFDWLYILFTLCVLVWLCQRYALTQQCHKLHS